VPLAKDAHSKAKVRGSGTYHFIVISVLILSRNVTVRLGGFFVYHFKASAMSVLFGRSFEGTQEGEYI